MNSFSGWPSVFLMPGSSLCDAQVTGADCLLLLTEWNEFRRPDFDKVKSLLKYPIIFDGRNQYDGERLIQRGFEYYRIGRVFSDKCS